MYTVTSLDYKLLAQSDDENIRRLICRLSGLNSAWWRRLVIALRSLVRTPRRPEIARPATLESGFTSMSRFKS